MPETAQQYVYPKSELMLRVSLFCMALLLPLIAELIGVLVAVVIPPRHALDRDLLDMFLHFYARLSGRIPYWVSTFCIAGWLVCIAATLPNAFDCSLSITVSEEGIAATFFGMRWRKISWKQVKRLEKITVQESDGIVWKAVSLIRIVSSGRPIVVRQSISNFLEFSQLISWYCEQFRIPVTNK
jgi:hypothetical protein